MIRRFLPFIFAGILGLAAVVLLQNYITMQRRALDAERKKLLGQYQALNPRDVLVARADIPADTKIAPEMLEKKPVPAQFHQPYSTERPSDLVGLITRVPLSKGEQILSNKLRRESEAPAVDTLSAATPQGMRAITIGTDVLTGVGGFVRPGDKVDILWQFQPPQPGGKPGDLVTMTLFQNIGVLAVGSEMVGRPSAKAQESTRDYTVTLALTPQQTAVVLYAREQGHVQLSLRSKSEKVDEVKMPPADLNTVMEAVLGPEAMPPPAQPHQPHTVEVIRGLDHSRVDIDE